MSNKIALEKLFLQFCHDIAGPIGTISNVSELMEYDAQCKQECSKMHELLQNSSKKAVLLLQLYRDIIFRDTENLDYIEFKELLIDFTSTYGITMQFLTDISISDHILKSVAIPTTLLVMKACSDIAKKRVNKNKNGMKNAHSTENLKIVLNLTADSCTMVTTNEFCESMGRIIENISSQFSLDFSNIKLTESQIT